jgi:GNAT superfamily N-acetyltransferase
MAYTVDTDLDRIDLDVVHRWLSTDAYWAMGRSRDAVDRGARESLNFAAFDGDGALCGYARVVTDHTTFAWICDVYVDRPHRGTGVGTLLMQTVMDALRPLNLRRIMLATADAHGVYERFGFIVEPQPDRIMRVPEA